jgi:hypothetical protein
VEAGGMQDGVETEGSEGVGSAGEGEEVGEVEVG